MEEQKKTPPPARSMVLVDAIVFFVALMLIAAFVMPQGKEFLAGVFAAAVQEASVPSPTPTATVTAQPTATPSPTVAPTPTPEPGDFSAAFEQAQLADGMDYVYECDDYKIGIDEVCVGDAVLLVADVYIRDIHVLKTAFAHDSFDNDSSKYENIIELCQDNNAMFAVSGDYVAIRTDGVVIRNGDLLRNSYSSDMCVLYVDGTMAVYEKREKTAAELNDGSVWQTWIFGPALLDDNGKSMEIENNLSRLNPRCAIGYYSPGHYCFVIVDGRQQYYSIGMTLTELSAYMESLGCKSAYNLDGGQTAQMVLDDGLVNQPTNGGRRVGDIIYLERMDNDE